MKDSEVKALLDAGLLYSPASLRENDVDYDVRVPAHTEELWKPSALRDLIEWLLKVVREENIEALAATGHSGLVPASIVAFTLGLPLVAVRKESERPQSGLSGRINGALPHRPLRYGIIDDLIASGTTVANILDHCAYAFPLAHCDVVFLYRSYVGEISNMTLASRDCIGDKIGPERAATIKIVGRPY